MSARKILMLVPFAAAAIGLSACDSIFGNEKTLQVRPVETTPTLQSALSDALYESGVTAVNAKDYGRALLYLQEARNKNPDSAKISNALGVVYDKLGRFDLSARYYAMALADDPASAIIAKNVEYSKQLQGLYVAEAPASPAAANVTAPPLITVSAEAPKTMVVAVAVSSPAQIVVPIPPVARLEKKSTFQALRVLDASGRKGGALAIGQRLKKLKWVVRQSDAGFTQSKTILLHAPGKASAARAIKRTLPFPVIMTADASGNSGITLLVGRDYLKWKPRSARNAALWKQQVVAALSGQNRSRL